MNEHIGRPGDKFLFALWHGDNQIVRAKSPGEKTGKKIFCQFVRERNQIIRDESEISFDFAMQTSNFGK